MARMSKILHYFTICIGIDYLHNDTPGLDIVRHLISFDSIFSNKNKLRHSAHSSS
jgi:hypothetical protein